MLLDHVNAAVAIQCGNVVEAHCYIAMLFNMGKYIVSNDVAKSINHLIAGHFRNIGLHMQLTKAYVAETSCNQLID